MDSTMKPEQVREARERMGWTQEQLATMMGVDVRTIHRWETRSIPETAAILLAKLMEEGQ